MLFVRNALKIISLLMMIIQYAIKVMKLLLSMNITLMNKKIYIIFVEIKIITQLKIVKNALTKLIVIYAKMNIHL